MYDSIGPVLGSVIGMVAGLVASAVMEGFQAIAAKPLGQESGGEPSTEKAADDASTILRGRPLPKPTRKRAGNGVHYLTGAVLGAGYGVLAIFWPAVTLWYGVAFGIATAILLDEIAVPAMGWAGPPWETPLKTHAFGLASHIVFGAALEGTRRLLVALL